MKIGIIGCGTWGVNYIRCFTKLLPQTTIRVCDSDAQRLAQIAQTYPNVDICPTVEALLSDANLEAVVVSTPASTHYHVSQHCLLAGKHVLCEKPLTTSEAEADDLLHLAQNRGLVLMVGHIFLYNDGIKMMKAQMSEVSFGAVYYLQATRSNLGPVRSDVNVVWDLASHDISIFNYLLAESPCRVSAVGRQLLGGRLQDVVFITLSYPSGVIGSIQVSWATSHRVRQVTVVSSTQSLIFDDLNKSQPVRVLTGGVSGSAYPNSADFCSSTQAKEIVLPLPEPNEPLKTQCLHFMDCINQAVTPLTNAVNGRDVVRIAAAIERSLQTNGQPVALEGRFFQ